MDAFSIPINQTTFPAKLWRMVNDPTILCIYWDNAGDGVLIEQGLFEEAFLSPQKTHGSGERFKTTNFTSFIRQLNIYGFRKVANTLITESIIPTGENGIQHYYFNPNFKRNHPELLLNLRRLTTGNKARLEAGLEVNCRPPNLYHHLLVNGNGDKTERMKKRGGSVFPRENQRASSQPYHPNQSQPLEEIDRTPIPPRNWTMGHGAALSPTIFYTNKGTQVPEPLIHRFPGGASSTTPLHIQQALQGFGNPGQQLTNFISPHAQYRPGFYSPVCQCTPPGSVSSLFAGCSSQTPSFSQFGYYKPNYPVSCLYPGSHNLDLPSSENQERWRQEWQDLDEVFQIVDELQVSPEVVMVKVGPPIPCEPIIRAASDYVPQGITIEVDGAAGESVKVEQMEEPVVPVPEDATQSSPDKVSSGKGKETVTGRRGQRPGFQSFPEEHKTQAAGQIST